jgi:Ca2+-binding RTX toxin-like protein
LRIVLSSSVESGLSHFSYDLSNLGGDYVGSSTADVNVGSQKDDFILGGDGDDTLTGAAGDDVIVDGNGSDILIGGQGADVFTFDPDGVDDTIQDFEGGFGALDLSSFPLLYEPQDLGYASTFFGARLTFQGETINIYSDDGTSLSLAELTAIDPFNVNRPALVLSSGGGSSGGGQTQVGTAADDTLIGTAGDDILTGNFGDDVLHGELVPTPCTADWEWIPLTIRRERRG